MSHLLHTFISKQNELLLYGYVAEIEQMLNLETTTLSVIIPTNITHLCYTYLHLKTTSNNYDILSNIFYSLTKHSAQNVYINFSYILTEFNSQFVKPDFESIDEAKKWDYYHSFIIDKKNIGKKELYSIHSNHDLLEIVSGFIYWICHINNEDNKSYSLSRISQNITSKYGNNNAYINVCKCVNVICMDMIMKAISYKHGYNVFDKIKRLLLLEYKYYKAKIHNISKNKASQKKYIIDDTLETWIKSLVIETSQQIASIELEIQDKDALKIYTTKFIETRDYICDKYGNRAFNDSVFVLKCVETYYKNTMQNMQ